MAFRFPVVPYDFEPMLHDDEDDEDDDEEEEENLDESDSSQTTPGVTEYACGLLKDVKRLQSQFTDVTIRVDGKVFHGHRYVLAAASRYFETMFSSGFQESQTKEVELKDTEGAIFEMIFNFMYSGGMELCKDTAVPACHAAAYLGVRNVEQVFINYFDRALRKKKMTPADLLSLWPGVDDNGMKKLSAAVRCDLMKTFKQVVESDQFVEKAPSELIHEYLKRGPKHFGSEEQLLKHVINWLKQDWEKRKHHTCTFLKTFRLALLPRGKVQELMDAEILEIPECKKMMGDLIATWTEFEGVEDLLKLPESLLPKGVMRTLIGFGGRREITECYRHELRAEEMRLFGHYYNKRSREWSLLTYPELPGNDWDLDWPSMVVVNRDIYLAGGLHNANDYSDDLCASKQLFKLDGNSYKWTNLPHMKKARFLFSMVHHEEFLYAIGGRAKSRNLSKEVGYLDSAERFNLSQQKWDCIYKLPAEIAFTSTAIVDGKILVYGLSYYLEREEAGVFKLLGFNPVTQKWTEYLQETYIVKEDVPDGIILAHDGVCYRVRYEKLSSEIPLPINSYEYNPWEQQATMKFTPHVNRIEMKPAETGEEGACIGHEVEGQATIPANEANAFQIDGHIYINVARFAHKTGAIQGDPNSKVSWNLNGWSRCYAMGTKCVVEYAFDTKKMR